jgi:dCTP deaminase
MPLSDKQIILEREKGNIIIEDWDLERLNACSYDVRISDKIKFTKLYAIDVKNKIEWVENNIEEGGYLLSTQAIYNSCIIGNFGVKGNICAKVMGKSSLGRLGLDVTVGDVGHCEPDFEGSLVIELGCKQPTIIYPNMKIAQVLFYYIDGEIERYYSKVKNSKYMNQTGIQTSLNHLNF